MSKQKLELASIGKDARPKLKPCILLKNRGNLNTAAIVILDVFAKTTGQMPQTVIDGCKARLKRYKSI